MEQKKCLEILFLIIIFFTSIIVFFSSKYSLLLLSSYPSLSLTKQIQNTSIDSNVLLFYVYADTHQYAYGNLKYFIDTAVRENDGVDYIFILQQTENKTIDESQYRCTIATNPYSDKSVDGVSLEPLDVIFVKFNDIQGILDAQNRAELYEKWTKNRTL